MGPFAYRSWVEISLRQIAENFQAVRAVVGPDVEVMPVVNASSRERSGMELFQLEAVRLCAKSPTALQG